MKKRLLGLAVLAGLVFAIGASAFAEEYWIDDVFASGGLTGVTVGTQQTTSINEGADETFIAEVTLRFSNGGNVQTPSVTFTKGNTEASLPYYWDAADGYELYGSNMKLVAINSESGNDDEIGVDHYEFKLLLYIGANSDSAGSYTGIIGYSGNTNTGTVTLTVNEYAADPVFSSAEEVSVELGEQGAVAGMALSNYKNSEVTWSINAEGETALNALNLTFNTENGTVNVKDKTSGNNGVDYGTTGQAEFTVTATVKKNPKPHEDQTVTLTVTGAEPATFSASPADGSDLAKLYDTYGKGIYVGDEIDVANANYEKAFKFTISGTIQGLSFNYDGLPAGLNVYSTTAVANNRFADGPDAKNGTMDITITGKPTTPGTSTFTITAYNNVGDPVTKTYPITVLAAPALADGTGSVTWNTAFTSTALEASNFAEGSDPIVWEVDDNVSGASYLTSANLASLGLSFNASNGTVSGTWKGNGDSGGLVSFGSSATAEKKVRIKATKYGKSAEADLTLTFNMVEPVLTVPAEMTFYYDESADQYEITAAGAGNIRFSSLPYDLSKLDLVASTSTDNEGKATYTISGTPNYVLGTTELSFTASNAAGSTTGTSKVTVKTKKVDILDVSELPNSGDIFSLGNVVGPFTVKASPAPVKWSVQTIFTVGKKDTERDDIVTIKDEVSNADPTGETHLLTLTMARPTGTYDNKFTNLTAIGSNRIKFTVTHVSEDTPAKATDERIITIRPVPVISTKVSEWKIADGKAFTSPKLETSVKNADKTNIVGNGSWDIRMSYKNQNGETIEFAGFDPNVTYEGDDAFYNQVNASGAYIIDDTGKDYTVAFDKVGDTWVKRHNFLYVTTNAKGEPIITGSFDRAVDGKITVRVYAVGEGNLVGSQDFPASFTAAAPKLDKNNIAKEYPEDPNATVFSWDVVATGTKPVTMNAYIAGKDAAKIYGGDAKTAPNISIMSADDNGLDPNYKEFPKSLSNGSATPNTTRLFFRYNKYDGKGRIFFMRYGSSEAASDDHTGQSYKGIPVTVTFDNAAVKDHSKPTTASLKLSTYDGKNAPTLEWRIKSGDGFVSVPDAKGSTANAVKEFNAIAGTPLSDVDTDGELTFVLKGDGPVTVTASQAIGEANAKNFLKIEAEDSDETTDGKIYRITGIPDITKETKNKITLTAKNNSTGASAKIDVTIVGQVPASIDAKYLVKTANYQKEFDLSKKVSIKLSATGSKPLTWDFANGTTAEDLSKYNLTLDSAKGVIEGTPEIVTANSDGTAYESKDFYVKAVNDAGESVPLNVKIGIKGPKVKINSKQVEVTRGSDLAKQLEENLIETDAGDGYYVTYKLDPKMKDTETAAVENIGIDPYNISRTGDNKGKLNFLSGVSDLKATTGTTLKFIADNYGTEVAGSIKIIVHDPKPVIAQASGINMTASLNEAPTDTISLSIADNTSTGDSKITWKINNKVDKPVTAKINIPDKTDTTNAELQITVAKVKADQYEYPLTIPVEVIATTSSIKDKTAAESEPMTVNITVNAPGDAAAEAPEAEAVPEDVIAPETDTEAEAETEAEPEAEAEENAGTLTFGNARTADDLTEAQKAYLAENGYQIVAVLPEVTADEDGLHDLKDIELLEGAPVGAELVYFPFPAEAEAEADEEGSTVFYGESGDITAVPEGKVVTVNTWLYAEKVYKPVIAVKAETLAEADAVTEEGLKEAADGAEAVTVEVVAEEAPETEEPEEEAAE